MLEDDGKKQGDRLVAIAKTFKFGMAEVANIGKCLQGPTWRGC